MRPGIGPRMKFRFSLAGLLRLRIVEEHQATGAVKNINRALATLALQRQELDSARRLIQDGLHHAMRQGALCGAEISSDGSNYFQKRTSELTRLNLELSRELVVCERKMTAARQRREILESLRDQQLAAYQRDEIRKEQSRQDERHLQVRRQIAYATDFS